MCDDVIEFIKALNIEKPILYGFSDGGIIGILVAIKDPNLLSKLIVSGANITPNAFTTFDFVLTKIFYFFTRSKYIKMMLNEPNIPLEDLQKITIPVHVLAGEKDVIKYEHTKRIASNIKMSNIVFPGMYKHIDKQSNGESDFEEIQKGELLDAKTIFPKKQCEKLSLDKLEDFYKMICNETNDIFDVIIIKKGNLNSTILYKEIVTALKKLNQMKM